MELLERKLGIENTEEDNVDSTASNTQQGGVILGTDCEGRPLWKDNLVILKTVSQRGDFKNVKFARVRGVS